MFIRLVLLVTPLLLAGVSGGIARAEGLSVGVGGVAGATVSTADYFPEFLLGLAGSVDYAVAPRVSLEGIARAQLYAHPEDEDFGSKGEQVNLAAGVRLDASRPAEDRYARPFLALHAGVALVHRVPYCGGCASENITGWLIGGAAGVELGSGAGPRLRLQLSYDRPSFTTHDDVAPPAGELAAAVMAVWYDL